MTAYLIPNTLSYAGGDIADGDFLRPSEDGDAVEFW